MRGFFFDSELLQSKAPIPTVPRCGACGLYKHCQSPKMEPAGSYKRKILIIGQAPGKNEDNQGEPFVGRSGEILKATLKKAGIDLRKDCLLTNALICRIPNDKFKPEDNPRIDHCRPNLIKTIKEYKPEIIIPLGREAIISLIGWVYKADVASDAVNKWIGWQIPEQTLNAWICPTWHPSYILRNETNSKLANTLKMFWEHHFKQAAKKKGRPWDKVPKYEDDIEIITNPNKAAKLIRYFTRKGGLCTFDYETNMLKPDGDDAQIVCCSICWRGKRTIAFPWMEPAISAMEGFLRSKRVLKMASNMKFEDRWSREFFGFEVQGWHFCTMMGAHVCDNRPDITGLKFQAFMRLGYGAYEEHVRPLLRGKKGEKRITRIFEEIDFNDLLLYCGLDSLLEYHVGIQETSYLGVGT